MHRRRERVVRAQRQRRDRSLGIMRGKQHDPRRSDTPGFQQSTEPTIQRVGKGDEMASGGRSVGCADDSLT